MVEDGSPRTFEVPPGGADSAGLEDYGVELRGGERIGTIVGSVEEDGKRWLVVETGLPPVKRDRRAIPWSEIEHVDHDALVVTVAASAAGNLTRLSEAGREDDAAPARRVTESPDEPSYVPTGDVAGPADRNALLFGALASFALGLLTLLAIVALLSRRGDHTLVWAALPVPVALLLAAGILGYRLWRDPYERRR